MDQLLKNMISWGLTNMGMDFFFLHLFWKAKRVKTTTENYNLPITNGKFLLPLICMVFSFSQPIWRDLSASSVLSSKAFSHFLLLIFLWICSLCSGWFGTQFSFCKLSKRKAMQERERNRETKNSVKNKKVIK